MRQVLSHRSANCRTVELSELQPASAEVSERQPAAEDVSERQPAAAEASEAAADG